MCLKSTYSTPISWTGVEHDLRRGGVGHLLQLAIDVQMQVAARRVRRRGHDGSTLHGDLDRDRLACRYCRSVEGADDRHRDLGRVSRGRHQAPDRDQRDPPVGPVFLVGT
jgi:hypothetical protein